MASGVELAREVRLKEIQTDLFRYHLLRIVPIIQSGVLSRWIGTFTDIHPQKQAANYSNSRLLCEPASYSLKMPNWNEPTTSFSNYRVVSHDLKEPLRKIQLFNDIVKQEYLKGNAEAITYLDRSIRSSAVWRA